MNHLRRKGSARKRVAKKGEKHLPDEIVIDVLSRVPAEDVLRCRCVCRRFKNLTSNQSFQDLHLKHCLPMILVVGDKTKGRGVTYLSDKWWEIGRKRSVIHRFAGKNLTLFSKYCLSRSSVIRFSLNGLIVSDLLLDRSKKFLVLNPTNGEHVIINVETTYSDVHGVYFHPLLKEYCTLWMVSYESWNKVEDVEYQVLNLGSKPCWKKIKNLTGKTSKTYCRTWCIAPVFIDKFLYWVVKVEQNYEYYDHYKTVTLQLDIMEFDIVSEELKMMPCPVLAAFKEQEQQGHRLYCNTNLLNIESSLSVVQINRLENLVDDINIWTLKDRVGQLWDCCNYRLNLDMYPSNFQFENRFSQAICAANGLLAIKSGSTLVVYNLKGGTMRILGKKKYDTKVFFSHLASFASLKNCKTDLYMDVSHLRRHIEDEDADVGRAIMCGPLVTINEIR